MVCKEMPRHLPPQPCRPKLLQFCSKFSLAARGCAANEIITHGRKFAPPVESSGTYQDRFQLLDSLPDVFHLFFDWAAACSSTATRASISSISIALAAWLKIESAARTRTEAGVLASIIIFNRGRGSR